MAFPIDNHSLVSNSKKIWNDNADRWIEFTEKGFDVYRDHINTPHFIAALPDIRDLHGLDIGCGTGHNTRLLAQLCASMVGIDISIHFINFSKQKENEDPLNIKYVECDATNLPFKDESFDFISSFQCLMDIQEYEKALNEAYRVLKRTGFFQFSVPHPCFWGPQLEWAYHKNGQKKGLICNDYFSKTPTKIKEWMFDGVDKAQLGEDQLFKTAYFRRSLTDWFHAITHAGFIVEFIEEPHPSSDFISKFPEWDGCAIVPYSIIFRCLKEEHPKREGR